MIYGDRFSTNVTVRKRPYRIGTVTRVSTQCSTHNFIDYLSTPTITFILAVARPVKARLWHCVRIQTVAIAVIALHW